MMKRLAGKIIISTRPEDTQDSICALLQEEGATVILAPMIEVCPIPFSLDEVVESKPYDMLIFTSKNGVQSFFEHSKKDQLERIIGENTVIYAIGKRTLDIVKNYVGNRKIIEQQGNTSEDLLAELNKNQTVNQRILLPQGKLASHLLEEGLSQHNQVKRIEVYDTLKVDAPNEELVSRVVGNQYDLILFTSPSALNSFVVHLGSRISCSELKIACIGATTQRKAFSYQIRPCVTASKADNFVTEIIEYLTTK